MAKFNDLTGKKFNRLFCLKWVNVDKRHNSRYLWKCDCGKIKEIDGSKVKLGYTKSCGCLSIKKRKLRKVSHQLPRGEAAFNSFYHEYKKSAEKRNKIFKLTKEEFRIITKKYCYYCNTEPKKKRKHSKNMYGYYVGNGIDRVDNKKGYTKENCVPCCHICNIMKQTLTKNEFINHINKIVKNFNGENHGSI